MLEELQHNYPLELLMALSNAAISAMKVLTKNFRCPIMCDWGTRQGDGTTWHSIQQAAT